MLEYLNQYFDKFIKQYHPYEEKEFYQILIKFIQENVLKDAYEEIPQTFKTLFEQHTLIPDIYDVILESLGYDKTLLNELSFNQKKTILNNFTNYYHDKGDLFSFNTICKIFNEPINLFELYIDYRVATSLFDWYFIPNPISLSPNTDVNDIIPLDYDEIYNATPTYFVNKASLINAYNTKAIKLPLKSNLLLLEVSSITASDELTNLTVATTLTYFKDLEIPIYIDSNAYTITIMGLYELWNYLLIIFHGKANSFESHQPIVLYDLHNDSFPYTLDKNKSNSLETIVDEYNSLSGMLDIAEFYDTRFRSVFLDYIAPHIVTLESIRRSLSFNVDINLIQYVDSVIGNEPTADSVSPVLSDLRNSFVNYSTNINEDPLFAEYSSVLLNVFELALVNPVNTATYKLIDFFKPYHTQLINKFKHGIEYKSKFTNALINESVQFITHQYEASAAVISIDAWFSERLNGICEVINGTEIAVDEEIANQFEEPWNSYIYWVDNYSRYPDNSIARRVVSKYWTNASGSDPAYWTLVLESDYPGLTGIFDYCYKRYRDEV